MELTQIKNAVDNIKGGQYVPMEYHREITPKKNFKDLKIEKYVRTIVRLKCNYANLSENKIKNYTPSPTHQNNMEYIENYKDSILKHKEKDSYYLKYTISKCPKHKTIVKWFLNGVEVTKQHLIELNCLLANDLKSSQNDKLVFMVNIDNITRLGNFS